MQIQHEIIQNHYCLLKLEGKFQSDAIKKFKDYLDVLILELPLQKIILDFNSVNMIDSKGIGQLILMYRSLKEKNIQLMLIEVDVKLLFVMKVSKIDKLMNIYASLQDALNATST